MLVHLQVVLGGTRLDGDCGHGWSEGAFGHGDGQALGAGLPVWRSGGQLDGVLVQHLDSAGCGGQLDGILEQSDLDSAGSGGQLDGVLVQLGKVFAGCQDCHIYVWFWEDNLGCVLGENDPVRANINVGLGAVLTGEAL